MEENCDVIYTGKVLEGFAQDAVVRDFSALLKISREQAEEIIFSNTEAALKENIAADVAEKYRQQLTRMGLEVLVRSKTPKSDVNNLPAQDRILEERLEEITSEAKDTTNLQQERQDLRNPYLAPNSKFSLQTGIDDLDVSDTWKKRFRTIEAAGGVNLPYIKELSLSQRLQIFVNILAFLFWIIYLPIKGMWRPALAYFGLALAAALILDFAGLDEGGRVIGSVISAVAMIRTNLNYYRYKVLGETPWF